MPGQSVPTWIWRKCIIVFVLAAAALSACGPANDFAATEVAEYAPLPPQTPKPKMNYPSSGCRIRDEIPLGGATTLDLPAIDAQALQEGNQNLPKDAPLRYAVPNEVNIHPADYGQWEKTDDDVQVWRLKVISPQALSLSLGFTSFNMPEGGCLFVYSPDRNQVLGPYTKADNAEHGQLWTPDIFAEEVFIEVSVPTDQISRMQLVLGFVNQGYKK
jgi:hypothetical protein